MQFKRKRQSQKPSVLHDRVTGKPPPGWGSPEDAVCPICRVAISELPDHHEHVEVTDEDEREERA